MFAKKFETFCSLKGYTYYTITYEYMKKYYSVYFFFWKEMWPLNKWVFYVQIQAAKPVYSDSSLDKLFCLTNGKSGNQLWQLGSVHEIYIFLRGQISSKSKLFFKPLIFLHRLFFSSKETQPCLKTGWKNNHLT